jgi:hypothetical protein
MNEQSLSIITLVRSMYAIEECRTRSRLAVTLLAELLEHLLHALDVPHARAPAGPIHDDRPLERARRALRHRREALRALRASFARRRRVRGHERGERDRGVLRDRAELVRRGHLLRDVEVEVERRGATRRVRLGRGGLEQRERLLRGLRGGRVAGRGQRLASPRAGGRTYKMVICG